MLTKEIKSYMDRSVLCWLATADANGIPNVSPKELFTYHGDKHVIIANIASPGTMKNLKINPKIAVSFVDVLVQKGYQLKGEAAILKDTDERFETVAKPLKNKAGCAFPFKSITMIEISTVKKIMAPSYLFSPDTKEEDQIKKAKQQYGL